MTFNGCRAADIQHLQVFKIGLVPHSYQKHLMRQFMAMVPRRSAADAPRLGVSLRPLCFPSHP